jgi:Uma2 family endonuclease
MALARKTVESASMTYEDLIQLPGEERRELFFGVPFAMAPAPSRRHQEVAWELARQIGNFLRGRPCRGFAAPFDVRLPEAGESDEETSTVVQPDISVVCDEAKLDDRGCRGAPDWIVEVVSPRTASNDYIRKVEIYERHGVREYWIVHPVDRVLILRTLDETGRYGIPEYCSGNGRLGPRIFPELELDMDAVFGEDSETSPPEGGSSGGISE